MTANGTTEITDGTVTLQVHADTATAETQWRFIVREEPASVGELRGDRDGRSAVLHTAWSGTTVVAVRLLLTWAQDDPAGPGLTRVETHLPPDDDRSLLLAARAGFRREGIRRDRDPATAESTDRVVLARLADDPAISSPQGFRALLNAALSRQRVIGQALLRDEQGRVLMCGLTYKPDWDLPGGVIEVAESPRSGVSRELGEELGLRIELRDLLLVDWLPPWGGWDAAACLVFDGGEHQAELTKQIVRDGNEIRQVAWLDPEQVRARAADFTARRVAAALAAHAGTGPRFTESGRPWLPTKRR